MIKPKDESLRLLSLEVYKKLPIKKINYRTIRFLAKKYPQELLAILNSNEISNENILSILDIMSKYKNDSFQENLFKYINSPIPAIRESALYALSKYNTKEATTKLLEVGINDANNIIKEIATSYFDKTDPV